ncbi:MAG TPA: YceI family protein [Rhodanobacteraceae bacterium]|nr:YceI family protein [Rhodanobacteraceae bacterium]
MKRLPSILSLLLLSSLSCAAWAKDWQVDAAHSTLGFTGQYQGDAFHGTFKRFGAKIRYDPANLATASFDVTVDLGSVDTQSSERDETLTGTDFFDIASTLQAHFVSRSFARGADGSVTAQGILTLHDVSKPVTLKVTFTPAGGGATLDVDATLNRLDFNLGSSNDWVDIGKTVAVHGHLQLR